MALTDRPMDVLTEAERLGFHVFERVRDTDWPSFATRGEALAWMEDRLRRGGVFDK